jgi:hypothetical protein
MRFRSLDCTIHCIIEPTILTQSALKNGRRKTLATPEIWIVFSV